MMGANICSFWVRVHTLCLVVHKDGLLLLSFILPQGIILDGWYNWQYHETFFFPMAGPIRNLAFWMQCYNITKNERKKKSTVTKCIFFWLFYEFFLYWLGRMIWFFTGILHSLQKSRSWKSMVDGRSSAYLVGKNNGCYPSTVLIWPSIQFYWVIAVLGLDV